MIPDNCHNENAHSCVLTTPRHIKLVPFLPWDNKNHVGFSTQGFRIHHGETSATRAFRYGDTLTSFCMDSGEKDQTGDKEVPCCHQVAL